ncbi:hypothetical protein ILUMI_02010 [Ignelater luminosus]|uniref:Uncharacterized protein n=1 Tax=Ignelater luminosus TaxID=2038154 RepID=A0A8K0DH77_IGNLU|nr:hypothetical protein ILUMI_02010 [Ignelater luminosus]
MAISVSAGRNSVPPFFVFPCVHYKQHFVRGGPPGSVGSADPSGWMKKDNFIRFMQYFVNNVKCVTDRPVLLLLDHHLSIHALDFAKNNGGKSRKTMAALGYECNRAVKATTMDCCATSGIGIACGNRHPCLKIYFTIKLTLNLTLNVVKLKPKVFLKTSITLGGLLPEFTVLKTDRQCGLKATARLPCKKWIFKSATTSTKTTATSEPARSSKTVATAQPPTSSNNVEQAKEVEVEDLPSKPPTSRIA